LRQKYVPPVSESNFVRRLVWGGGSFFARSMPYNRAMGLDSGVAMKPLLVTLLARALVWMLFAVVAAASGAFCFQCLFWLRSGSWLDWTDLHGLRFRDPFWSGGAWKGANIAVDFFLSAPIQLSASIAGLVLVGIYILVRSLSPR